jgi:hypothetical protein
MFPTPTQIDLAVAMKQLDIKRESGKTTYLDHLPSETYGATTRRLLGRVIGASKSILGQAKSVDRGYEGQSSSGSLA